MRREKLPLLGMVARDSLTTAQERELLKRWPELMAVRGALMDGRRRSSGLRKVAALPEAVRKNRGVLIVRVQAALLADEQVQPSGLEEIQRQLPEESCVDLIRIEALMQMNKPAEVLAAVDRLDRAVGGDAYLDTVRANAHVAAGDLGAAKQAADRVPRGMPDLPTTYLLRLAISLQRRTTRRRSVVDGAARPGGRQPGRDRVEPRLQGVRRLARVQALGDAEEIRLLVPAPTRQVTACPVGRRSQNAGTCGFCPSEMSEDGLGRAAGLLQGVAEHGEAVPRFNRPSGGRHRRTRLAQGDHVRRPPKGIDGQWGEAFAEDVAEEGDLVQGFV